MADLARLDQCEVTRFIEGYESLKACHALNEYTWPKKLSTAFTYHKHKGKNGHFLDDGKCEVCGKDRQYLLIQKGAPKICYRCYQACRGYSKLLFDPLKLKKKRDVSAADAKKIVKYMNKYSKEKLVALAAVSLYLMNKE